MTQPLIRSVNAPCIDCGRKTAIQTEGPWGPHLCRRCRNLRAGEYPLVDGLLVIAIVAVLGLLVVAGLVVR